MIQEKDKTLNWKANKETIKGLTFIYLYHWYDRTDIKQTYIYKYKNCTLSHKNIKNI